MVSFASKFHIPEEESDSDDSNPDTDRVIESIDEFKTVFKKCTLAAPIKRLHRLRQKQMTTDQKHRQQQEIESVNHLIRTEPQKFNLLDHLASIPSKSVCLNIPDSVVIKGDRYIRLYTSKKDGSIIRQDGTYEMFHDWMDRLEQKKGVISSPKDQPIFTFKIESERLIVAKSGKEVRELVKHCPSSVQYV